ncbi:TlpA family protein disulfide reductase [Mucilaginibacter sp. SJ]|uniref:TlpA family protein disulfide reductase n=1 Tax=Mucilaginibacter sp. SJ TaxID=3029053 RepID=UPI0023A924E3|nr:TlpA disulfide reductase family protein [Mucilaginibacter sp. SJ]WEA00583.1 TlpA disulfide reductase family protein [Mucilaginibacter sp. SJ]
MKKNIVVICLLLIALTVSAQSKKMTTYSGMITGYTTSFGFTTGKLIINNVVTSLHEMYLINIEPSGKFLVTFPLKHNQECWVSLRFFNGPVYFEAGKEVVQNFNLTNTSKISSAFQGAGAVINNDINKVRPALMDYNWNAIYTNIDQLTPGQYKTYFLKMQAHKLAYTDSVAKTAGLNKTAYELARRSIQYNIASNLMSYNEIRESVFRKKHNISFNNREPMLSPVKLRSEYYDFLKALRYNEPKAMISYFYYEFVNKLMFMDLVYDQAGRLDFSKQIALLKTRDTTNEDIKGTIKLLEDQMSHKATAPGALEKARPVVLKKLLNTNIALESDLMYLQSVSSNMDMQKDTLTDAALARLKLKVKNKFLLNDVAALNSSIKQSILNVKNQTGYTDNQVPVTDSARNIFVKLLDKYKGKVVFIDFWATWCVPCLNGMQEIAPLKAELAQNKDVVFLYVTNTSSPEKTYQTMMPGIKGEHYRLPDSQYDYLAKLFKIFSIPHYAIINKRGEIVNDNFQWSQTNQIKQQLMSLMNE